MIQPATRFIITMSNLKESATRVTATLLVTRIEYPSALETLSIFVTYDLCGEGTKIDSELSSYDTLLILSRLSRYAHRCGCVFPHEYLKLDDQVIWDYDENDLPLN